MADRLPESVREAVANQFAPEHREAVLAEFGSMEEESVSVSLTQIQLALVDLSGGDPDFIVTRGYRKSDWRDLVAIHQAREKTRQLRALDVGALVTMLDDQATRFDALETLDAKGSEALPAVQRLVELLRDEDQLVVTKVLRTLGAIGPAAQAALPALRELVNDKDYLIRYYAQAAAKSISPSAAT
jgi:hypothetical protein